ncbi:MAG TPA: DsbC family protein [Marinobacter sp.]|nr:DsbC family protein [Marinobacter sp.]
MNLKIAALLAGALLTLAGSPHLLAGETEERITKRLTEAVPGLRISGVRESEAKGLYEVQSNSGEIIYTTADGAYLLTGDLLKVTGSGIANVSEQTRAAAREKQMAAFGRKGLISYPAKGEEKVVIDVFTDIDCPFCRKLHDDIPALNGYGITVNYYAFPRSGPGTPSFIKYESVWCSEDQQAAMDAAKAGQSIPPKRCDNPVQDQYRLGGQVGVTGTPALLLEDGSMIRGYVPAEELAAGLGLL